MDKYPQDVLVKIKKNLLDEKKKLEERMSKLSAEDPFANPERTNDNAASDTDAKEEVDHERIEVLKQDIVDNVAAIDEALVRIGTGTYGFCANCKKMIDTDRLAIYPTALYCIECEQKHKAKTSVR